MKKRVIKAISIALATLLFVGMLAGCGGKGDNDTEKETDKGTEATEEVKDEADTTDKSADSDETVEEIDSDNPYEGVTLKYVVTDTQAEGKEAQEMVAMVKEKTGIDLEFTIIPTASDGEVDKTLVALQAGDPMDIIAGTTSKLNTFYNAGVLAQIDDLAANTGYDMEEVFGDNLPKFDGGTYGLPAFSDIWLTYINTKWFEEAGIEVPSAEGWTWEKYVETAQAITDAGMTTESGMPVFGSFMETYDCYNYMVATQKGVSAYKDDGTANFDDPAFRESMEFYYSLGNDLKIQPDVTNMMAGTYAWNQFVAADDMAMFVCGGWVSSMLPNTEQYPRDWECAILPMPYPEGEDPSTLTITSCYAIPSTSENKEAAFEVLKCMAEDQYTLGYGRVPSRVDLTDEEVTTYVEDVLIKTTFANDAVVAEDLKTAWFDTTRKALPEKIIGTAEGTIGQIWIEEAQLYGVGSKSLDDAIESIQERSNKAISEELATQ